MEEINILEKAKLMQLEIEEKRKLPKKIKDNISTNIFQDLLVAIIIMLYFCAVNFSYYKFESNVFEEIMKYFALGIVILTVIIFELSYRKNSIKLLIIGLELFHVLFYRFIYHIYFYIQQVQLEFQ